ncbi:unnamed protein product [Allacma fusca]|uniref:Uncharacterized protein n=1 Tax=Allacma fusca TaxID=39272 RepID=A0A8J2JYV0_9HEXA|nr:unnamed protein product [Allacma fusca]
MSCNLFPLSLTWDYLQTTQSLKQFQCQSYGRRSDVMRSESGRYFFWSEVTPLRYLSRVSIYQLREILERRYAVVGYPIVCG